MFHYEVVDMKAVGIIFASSWIEGKVLSTVPPRVVVDIEALAQRTLDFKSIAGRISSQIIQHAAYRRIQCGTVTVRPVYGNKRESLMALRFICLLSVSQHAIDSCNGSL